MKHIILSVLVVSFILFGTSAYAASTFCVLLSGGTVCFNSTASPLSLADNTTLNNMIAGNNVTLSDRIALEEALQAANNNTQKNLISALTTKQGSDNTTLKNWISGVDTRQASDNTTVANNITAINTRIGTLSNKQASDNTTTGIRIGSLETLQTADNTTIANLYYLKTAFASENTTIKNTYFTLGQWSSENTTINNLYFRTAAYLSGNTTLSNRLQAIETKQGADNTTLSNWINGVDTQQKADNTTLTGRLNGLNSDNTTQKNAIDLVTTRQSADNTTLTDRINAFDVSLVTANNNTLTNLITANNNTVANLYLLKTAASSDNTTQNNWISSIDGRQTADNITIANLYAPLINPTFTSDVTINGNLYIIKNITNINAANVNINGTFLPAFDNLFDFGSSTLRFANGYFSTEVYVNGVGLLGRLNGNNQTLSDLIATLRSDNTTQGNLIATLQADNTTQGNLIATLQADNTTQASLISGLQSDNTTQNNQQTSDNTTIRNTAGFLAQSNVWTNGNLFQSVVNLTSNFYTGNTMQSWKLYADGGWDINSDIGLGRFQNLTVMDNVSAITFTLNGQDLAGNLTNLGSRIGTLSTKQLSDNTTQANIQSADNSTTSTRIGNLETKQSGDNTTLTDRLNGLNSDNTTQSNQITALTNRQSSDNTTQQNTFETIVAEQADNTTQGNLIDTAVTTESSDNTTLSNRIGQGANQSQTSADNTTQANLISGLQSDNITQANLISGLQSDNTTQKNLQASDNTTLKNTGAFLSANNIFSGTNYFQSINATGIAYLNNDVRSDATWASGGWIVTSTGDIYGQTLFLLKGINTTTIQQQNINGSMIPLLNNQFTLGNSTHQYNAVWATNVNATNIYAGTVNLLTRSTSDNTTLTAWLGTKVNLSQLTNYELVTAHGSDNTTLQNWINGVDTRQASDNTTTGNRFSSYETTTAHGSDNTTLGNRIGTQETKQGADNITTGNRFSSYLLGTAWTSENTTIQNLYYLKTAFTSENTTSLNLFNLKANWTNHLSDNTTLTALLGQKLNLTGGTLSGALTGTTGTFANGLNVTAGGLIVADGNVGIGTTGPSSRLHVNGNITIPQNTSFICLNIACTQYIRANSTGVLIQG